jgi:hypothetical protein
MKNFRLKMDDSNALYHWNERVCIYGTSIHFNQRIDGHILCCIKIPSVTKRILAQKW